LSAQSIRLLLILAALWGVTVPDEAAAREPVKLDLESMVLSRFVWRGEMWTDDPVFWQTATLRYKGLRAWNFFNVDLTSINGDRFELNEYDTILDYTFSFGRFSVAPGVLHFSSPTHFFPPSTKITLDVKTMLPLQPRLRVRVDPSASRGSYYIFSLAQRVSSRRGMPDLDLYASLGVSEPRYYRRRLDDRLTVTDALLGVSVPLNVGKGFTLAPYLEFTTLLDHSVREAQRDTGARRDALTGAVVLSRGMEF
jgi:hypothetical protein